MRTLVGTLVDSLLVGAVRLVENVVPNPATVGRPLAPSWGRRADPVILVAGYSNRPAGWEQWVASMRRDGFDVHVAELPTNGLGDMRESAKWLAALIESVRRRTGRSRVDVIGFSEGGLLARMAVAMYGAARSVDRVVTLATPHGGIRVGPLLGMIRAIPVLGSALPPATYQMEDGHQLLRMLNQADAGLRAGQGSVRYTSIHSRAHDGLVSARAGTLELSRNIVLATRGIFGSTNGPSHYEIYHMSNEAYEAARALLVDRDFDVPDVVVGPGLEDARRGAAAVAGLARGRTLRVGRVSLPAA